MAPFVYQPYRNPYVNSISDLMLRQGDVQAQGLNNAAAAMAQGQRASGQAWGQGINQVGQDISGAIQQATNPQRQLAQGQVADLKALDRAFSQPGTRQQIIDQLPGHLKPQIAASFAAADEAQAKVNEANLKAEGATNDYVTTLAEQVKANDYAPEALQLALTHAKQTFGSNPSLLGRIAPIEAALHTNPTPEGVQALIDPILKAHEAQEKPVILPATPRGGAPAQLVKPSAGQVVATGQPAPPPAPTAESVAMDAATLGTPNETPTAKQSATAIGLTKGGKTTSEWEDFKQATAKSLGTSDWTKLTPGQQESAVTRFKLIGPESSRAAATERQTATIGAQVAQQKRSQDFQVLQAARADIQKNVDTPYATARTSADTLRDVVASAQAGNKVAGSLQSLETTMAAIRAQGLNRINTAEIGMAGNAGNVWDKIQGWFGKKAEGQPVPPDIQKDMLQFADILEKAAYKKYSDSHDATNKLYGTTIPKTYTTPAMVAPPTNVELTPGLAGVLKR